MTRHRVPPSILFSVSREFEKEYIHSRNNSFADHKSNVLTFVFYFQIDEPTLQVPLKDYVYLMLESSYVEVYADKIVAAARKFGIENETLAKQDAMEVAIAEREIAVVSSRAYSGIVSRLPFT